MCVCECVCVALWKTWHCGIVELTINSEPNETLLSSSSKPNKQIRLSTNGDNHHPRSTLGRAQSPSHTGTHTLCYQVYLRTAFYPPPFLVLFIFSFTFYIENT